MAIQLLISKTKPKDQHGSGYKFMDELFDGASGKISNMNLVLF
jgi:hypothetical protein